MAIVSVINNRRFETTENVSPGFFKTRMLKPYREIYVKC